MDLNQRIKISHAHHWARGVTGTIVNAPREVRRLSPGWLNDFTLKTETLQGQMTSYWVRFDFPQFDPDGDGPYSEAAVDESFIEESH